MQTRAGRASWAMLSVVVGLLLLRVVGAQCGNGVVDGDEECDLSGTCLGGNKAGATCTSEADCGLDQNGVCFGGSKAETACDPADVGACPGGNCTRCVPQGGNGCATNCTTETEIVMNLEPGELSGVGLAPGTSGATLYNGVLGPIKLPFQPGTRQTLAVGKERNGRIPVVVLAASVHFPKIDVSGLACACVRGVGAKTCGGMSFNANGTAATDCTDGFTAGPSVCPADLPCAYVHGNGGSCSTTLQTCAQNSDCPEGETCVRGGNSAAGIISCTSGLQGVDVLFTQDSRGASDPAQCDPANPCAEDNPCVPPECDCWKPTTGSVPDLCGDPPVLQLSVPDRRGHTEASEHHHASRATAGAEGRGPASGDAAFPPAYVCFSTDLGRHGLPRSGQVPRARQADGDHVGLRALVQHPQDGGHHVQGGGSGLLRRRDGPGSRVRQGFAWMNGALALVPQGFQKSGSSLVAKRHWLVRKSEKHQ
jgi:hypothetical protein